MKENDDVEQAGGASRNNGRTEAARISEDEGASEDGRAERPEEGDDLPPPRRGARRLVVGLVIVGLLANGLGLFPLLFGRTAERKAEERLVGDEAVAAIRPAIVAVVTPDGHGTGFNIAPEGAIVTNRHVVGDAGRAWAVFPDGRRLFVALVWSDPSKDLALLRPSRSGAQDETERMGVAERSYPVLPLADRMPRPGEAIVVVGHPLFETDVAVRGTVLGPVRLKDGREAIALDAPIFPGNSGSPVLAADGTVLAVVFGTATLEGEKARRAIGLAVPVAGLSLPGGRP
ncbi:serine protease [Hydrogenibacillus sp. N12]|uniref:S1 family peptidase n=1 Tax=Hydrogenibacillus sp. N12 TaxID=2866627 RepID=UPI00207BD8E4|nr:serine protease [Hydrogenibacillus sp. N12]